MPGGPFPPMRLTALAVLVGASVILADPIFEGLAIALMASEIASLLISRMAVPVLYFMANKVATGTILASPQSPEAQRSDVQRPAIGLRRARFCSAPFPH